MNEVVNFVPRPLPSLADLHHDIEEAFKNDELQRLCNQPVPKAWIKKHPMTSKEYLPIDKVEYLLTRVFGIWKREILSVQQIFNSVVVTVRLHLQNPFTGEWFYYDGVGAMGAQTDAGSGAANMNQIKFDAIQKAAPAAASYALKDAAGCLGILFGKNLNKKDGIEFAGMYQDVPNKIQNSIAEPSQTNSLLDIQTSF